MWPLEGCHDGSMGWVPDSWFWLRSWYQGCEMEPHVGLCAQQGVSNSPLPLLVCSLSKINASFKKCEKKKMFSGSSFHINNRRFKRSNRWFLDFEFLPSDFFKWNVHLYVLWGFSSWDLFHQDVKSKMNASFIFIHLFTETLLGINMCQTFDI